LTEHLKKIMSNYQDGFIVRDQKKQTRFYIDNEFLKNGYVALLQKRSFVYMCLAKYANAGTQTCYPAYDTIQKETGMKNRNTLARAINVLEYLGLIGIKRALGSGPNRYYLLHHSQWRPLTSITIDTAKAVSKMLTKEYQKRRLNSISSDTGNQRMNSTKEIRGEDMDSIRKRRLELGQKLSLRGKFSTSES